MKATDCQQKMLNSAVAKHPYLADLVPLEWSDGVPTESLVDVSTLVQTCVATMRDETGNSSNFLPPIGSIQARIGIVLESILPGEGDESKGPSVTLP